MSRRIILTVVIVSIFLVQDAYAGGAAAMSRRRPQGGRVTRHIQLTPEEQQEQASPESVEEPPEIPQKPASTAAPGPVYAPGRVLTTSGNQQPASSAQSVPASSAPVLPPLDDETRQSIAPLLERFDQSSQFWPQIDDIRVKGAVLQHYIELYHQFGIYINKPPVYYANMINAMVQENPGMLNVPMDQVLRVVAIIEYDYDDGQSKDSLARTIFQNDAAFHANKKRLGLE